MQIIQFLISSLKIKPLTSKKDTLSSNKEHKHDRLISGPQCQDKN